MEIHIYKTEKAPSGRTVKLDELECTYNLKDTFIPSSQLLADILNIFPKSEIDKVVNTLLGVMTILSNTGALKVDKNKKDVDFDLQSFFNDENSKYSKMVMDSLLSLVLSNFNKAIDASQLILEQQRIYLTREQVSAIEPHELAKIFFSLFRYLLFISKTVK